MNGRRDAMAASGAAGGRTPRSRTVRPLAGVLSAVAVSTVGTRVSAVALPWFVLTSTGSATRTGLATFFEITPYVLVKALAGPLVDRIGPRTVSWTTDSVSAAAVGAVPLLHTAHLLSFPLLMALVAVTGAMRGPGDTAKDVMVPQASDLAAVPLERATGLAGAADRLAAAVGPALGGVLVSALGPLPALAADALSFAAGSLIITLTLPRAAGRAAARERAEEPGYRGELREGLVFLRGEPLVLRITLMVGVTNMLDQGFSTVLLPVWARAGGHGAAGVGLVMSVRGAAALCGSVAAAVAGHRLPRRAVFFIGFLLAGAPRYLILAAGAPMGAVLAVFAVAGSGAGFLNPIIGAIVLERVPRRLLGRVAALGDSVAWAGMPLGGLLAAGALALAGFVPVLLAYGAAYLLTTGATGLRPEWRAMNRPRGEAA